MSILELINIGKVRRAILYAGVLFAALVVQNLILSRFPLFGAKALFVPALVVAVGLFEGGVWGGVFGLFAGMLSDGAFSASTVTFTIVFPVIGFFSGFLTEFVINRRFFSYMLLSLCALGLTALCQIFPVFAFQGSRLGALLATACIQTLWSLPFAAPLYATVKAISENFDD